jgi:hypothetical protein
MKDNNFKTSITADISAGDTLKKICNIGEWWGVTVMGQTAKQDDSFTIKMGGDSFFNMTVTELINAKRLVWLVTDCNMPWYTDKKEWSGTRLIFDFEEHNGTTTVSFTHEGLTPHLECYNDCDPGWTHWIKTSLLSYLTTGKGVFRAPTK